MDSTAATGAHKRTAVLVVHGMGSQRPLDTVRGIVDAVWLEGDKTARGLRRIWTHPERSGVDDIDLPVITTNFIPDTHRRTDFHELYWAHLMSETRAVAVLLWLFELARMGPRLKPSIGALYWAALIFLSVLILSFSLIAVQIIVEFCALIASATAFPFIGKDVHSLIFVFFAAIAVTTMLASFAAIPNRAFKLAAIFLAVAAVSVLLFVLESRYPQVSEALTEFLLPTVLAAMIVQATMGGWGLLGLGIVFGLSYVAAGLAALCFGIAALQGHMPWSINSFWSSIAACYFIGLYLALYAVFLQPYLGDAARYFRNSPGNVAVRREIRRQAVRMLEALHLSNNYDRIVVVAHSLGTVVSYDMLRAYYSRVNDVLPDPGSLGAGFDEVDRGTLDKAAAREKGREMVARIAWTVGNAQARMAAGKAEPGDDSLKAWLVTDFVTLGSPLTHALYLMCRGNTESELQDDFARRTREREFPTCPPLMIDGDYRLTFENPNDHKRQFHHGGQFALTRWTNLYFPVSQLLWGDAIGGEVGPLFGDPPGTNVADVPVYTNTSRRNSFFAHVHYWDLKFGNSAPHIEALKKAIDLADTGAVNGL